VKCTNATLAFGFQVVQVEGGAGIIEITHIGIGERLPLLACCCALARLLCTWSGLEPMVILHSQQARMRLDGLFREAA
jgi:hypothetical protein